ncbi:MAG: PilZ domain-containing protein [Phycisphaerae bacterium]
MREPSMHRIQERRRHTRWPTACRAVVRDKAGRVLMRGRGADVSPGGICIVGPGSEALQVNMPVWVELSVPSPRASGPPVRIVKVHGEIRRVTDMGGWKSILVVVFDSDFERSLLDPIP